MRKNTKKSANFFVFFEINLNARAIFRNFERSPKSDDLTFFVESGGERRFFNML